MSKYPKYKDSGVEWLGEIPKHWISTKIKNMLSVPITDGPHETPDFLDTGVPFVSAEAISKGYINFDKIRGHISIEANNKYSQKYSPKLHDVYMIKSGATTGVTAIVDNRIDFNIWSPLAVFRAGTSLNSYYLLNYLRSSNFQKAVELYWTYGTQQNIGMNVLENLYISVPPLQEQQTIANYLDLATAKIDTLIEKQTKLIALLKEKRQAVISTAVTRGLDSTVAMKDSGVEWLGEIPVGWEALQLKRISSIKGGYAYATSDFEDEGIQIIKIGNVYQSKFHTDRQPTFISLDVAKKTREFLIAEGDLIISLTGTLGKRDYGYAVTVDKKGEYRLNQRVAKMIPNNKLVATKYLSYIMKSEQYLTQIYALPAGTKQANLSNDDVLSAVCALPSLEEQEKIVRHIDDKTSKIDNLITKSTKAIDLLKEKRTALISSAVTGKIDVREINMESA